jgi:hypothetical protein
MAFLVGQGPIALTGGFTSNPLSQTSPQPGSNPPLGTRAQDAAGNVYILCDSTSTLFSGLPVVIQDDYTCNTIATGVFTGRIGVNQANATSDQLVWVQVYGRAMMQVGGSNVSPSELLTTVRTSAAIKFIVPTSLSTPASLSHVTDASSVNTGLVMGMWIANDVTLGDVSAVTSSPSHTGSQVPVFLNYPYVQYLPGTGDVS